jgi:hypothetical protein
MLWAAYGLLGLRLQNGELRTAPPAAGELRPRRLVWQGRELR